MELSSGDAEGCGVVDGRGVVLARAVGDGLACGPMTVPPTNITTAMMTAPIPTPYSNERFMWRALD
jgi:hypothetical protein